jgi:hypothetical protein
LATSGSPALVLTPRPRSVTPRTAVRARRRREDYGFPLFRRRRRARSVGAMSNSTRHSRRPVLVTLALAVAAALVLATPAPAGVKAGTYSGTTSQQDEAGDALPLQLKVSRNKKKVTVVFFELSAPPCGGGGMGTLQYAGLVAKIKRNGSFNAKSPPYGYVKGKFNGKKAKGTARYEVHQNGVDCDSGKITWSARRG